MWYFIKKFIAIGINFINLVAYKFYTPILPSLLLLCSIGADISLGEALVSWAPWPLQPLNCDRGPFVITYRSNLSPIPPPLSTNLPSLLTTQLPLHPAHLPISLTLANGWDLMPSWNSFSLCPLLPANSKGRCNNANPKVVLFVCLAGMTILILWSFLVMLFSSVPVYYTGAEYNLTPMPPSLKIIITSTGLYILRYMKTLFLKVICLLVFFCFLL